MNDDKEVVKSGVTSESEYKLFQPKGNKDLRELYEDLGNDPAFSDLSRNEMLFVWAYACAGSPFYNIPTLPERVGKCFEFAFDSDKTDVKTYSSRLALYNDRAWSSDVSVAIARMKQFNPSLRKKEYDMYRNTIDSYEEILTNAKQLVFPKNKGTAIDMDEAKKYVDLSTKINSEIGDLIRKLESSTGITKITKKETIASKSGKSESLMEKAMERDSKR